MADESSIESFGRKLKQAFPYGAILYPSIGNPELACGNGSVHLLIAVNEKLDDDIKAYVLASHLQFMSLEKTLRFKKGKLTGEEFHFPVTVMEPEIVKSVVLLDEGWASGEHPIVDIHEKGFQAIFNPAITKYFATGVLGGYKSPFLPELKKHGFDALLKFVYHLELDGPKLKGWIKKNLGEDMAEHCFVNWSTLGEAADAPARDIEEFLVTSALRDATLEGEHKFVGKRFQKDSDAFTHSQDAARKGPDGPLNSFDILNWNFRADTPVATLHPLFFYEDEPCLTVGYISDLHIVSRLEVMKHSDFAVIPGHSETLSSQMCTTGQAVKNLLNSAGKKIGGATPEDSDVGMLVVGGDLIDFSMSCYPGADAFKGAMSADMVRGMVNADSSNVGQKYDYGVDFIAFYDFIVEFYRTARKPVVILAGNHDAYDKPFGISPRVLVDAKMGNPGIPADVNLTVMEACLMYGDNYGKIFDKSNFKPEVMNFFYLLFTPVYSFTSKMAGMQLISLGWGDEERLLFNGPEVGHLPNAEGSLTVQEGTMVQKGADYAKKGYGNGPLKCLLVSHYTWVNYNEPILQNGAQQNFPVGDSDNISYFNMGACEKRRQAVYRMMLPGKDQKIHYAISGHSHRAGLYSLEKMDGGNVSVTGHSMDDFPALKDKLHPPYIIVSDSAGPIPRENINGDFNGHGSHKPSFAKLAFNANGELASVMRIPTNQRFSQPRLAVALDYVELLDQPWNATVFWIKGIATTEGMDSDYLDQMRRKRLTDFPLKLEFEQELLKGVPKWLGISKGSLFFKSPDSSRPGFIECPIEFRHDLKKWIIRDKDSVLVWLKKDTEGKGFLSLHLGPLPGQPMGTVNRYDYSKPWIVVVDMKIVTAGTGLLGAFADDFKIQLKRNWEFVKYPTTKAYQQLIPRPPGGPTASLDGGNSDQGAQGSGGSSGSDSNGGSGNGGSQTATKEKTPANGGIEILGVKIPSTVSFG
ncbi:MAG: calcineurin-like phosphoesterase [Fibrobacteres bacterium]|nr:calcineurin-like phosphoesterase [Fibrobacterota bacterium]